MIYNVGRTPAITQLVTGDLVYLINHNIGSMPLDNDKTKCTIQFQDEQGNCRYKMQVIKEDILNNARAGCYARSVPRSNFDNNLRPVILIDNIEISYRYHVPASPLIQMISPNISRVGNDAYQLTWWCNTDRADQWMSKKNPDGNTFRYIPGYVKRFNTLNITQINEPIATTAKVLCSAVVTWQNLLQVGGGVTDTYLRMIPVVSNPMVLAVIRNQGYVTDFAVSGEQLTSQDLTPIHSHTATNDGGFAAAVFMPSAIMRPLNWS